MPKFSNSFVICFLVLKFTLPCHVQVHQFIVLPLCHNLLDVAVPDLHEDPVIIFPDTSLTALDALVDYIYKGHFVAKLKDLIDVYKILRILGIPVSSSVRTLCRCML